MSRSSIAKSETENPDLSEVSASPFWGYFSPELYVGVWILVVLNFNLFSLAESSLWTDEVIMLITSEMSLYESLVQQQDYAAPLYQLVLRVLIPIFGKSESVLRLPALLSAIFCVPAIWWMASMMFNRNVAALAIPLMVLNPLFIQYTHEARPYSLFMLLSVLSMGMFFRWHRDKEQRDMLSWLIISAILVNTHYYGFLPFISQVIWVCFEARRNQIGVSLPRKPFLFTAFASTILILIAMWRFLNILLNGAPATLGGWIQPPSFVDVLSWRIFGDLFGLPNWGLLFTIGILSSLIYSLPTRINSGVPQTNKCSINAIQSETGIYFCIIWILVAVIIPAFIVPIVWRPVYITRYGLPAMIPLLLLVLVANDLLVPRKIRIIIPTIVVLLLVSQLQKSVTPRRGFPEVVNWIQSTTHENSTVFVADWSYVEGFVNPEIVGMQYYGLKDRKFRLLKLNHPYGSGFANPNLIPQQERFILVAFLNIDGISEHFDQTSRKYRLLWFDSLGVFNVSP
ncbi:glycosyltransferase family 39 protein [bacterium]|nr:glycosyltransferase family 39 protein [bacterium]